MTVASAPCAPPMFIQMASSGVFQHLGRGSPIGGSSSGAQSAKILRRRSHLAIGARTAKGFRRNLATSRGGAAVHRQESDEAHS